MKKIFEKEFIINVPAKGLLGSPPNRTRILEFVLPKDFDVNRKISDSQHGAKIIEKNLDNLTEVRLDIEKISGGIRIHWELENPHTFPVGGRTATIKIKLKGDQVKKVDLLFTKKYKKIRQRFFDKFYYSGHVAEFIEGNQIKFADQIIYLGQALIFLAAEVYIKRKIGQNVKESLNFISELLNTIEELDKDAERLFGETESLNGFIIRDSITGLADIRLRNKFSVVDSDFQKPDDAAPSGDQIFGLFFGLWFVVKFSEEPSIVNKLKTIADRIFRYAMETNFELKLPNGENVKRGDDLRWLSSLLHGLNHQITGNDRFDSCRIEVAGQRIKLNGVASFWDTIGDKAAAILKTNVDIPILGTQEINSFAAHILLMTIAPTDIWSMSEFDAGALAVNHHLAIIFFALAHKSTPSSFGFLEMQGILDLCPETEPRSDLAVKTGWQKDNRWIRCSNLDKPGSGQKEFNGVDFLILHNLTRIVFSDQL